MPYPLSPAMFAALAFVAGVYASDRDCLSHSCIFTTVAIAMAAGALLWMAAARRQARWRWWMAALCAVFFAWGWWADRTEWESIEAQQQAMAAKPSDSHGGFIAGTPRAGHKVVRAEVETFDGWRVVVSIPHALLKGDTLYAGDMVFFSSRLRPVDGSARWMTAQTGVVGTGYATRLHVVRRESEGLFDRLRVALLKRWRHTGLERRTEALTAAVMLADRSGVDNRTRTAFADAGAAHVLALSGMHLGLLTAVLMTLLGRWVRHRWRDASVVTVAVWTYVVAAGVPTTLVRAALLQTFVVSLAAMKRRLLLLDALWPALLVMLAVSPHALFDAGFQMSFACMFGIAVVPASWWRTSNWLTATVRTSVVCTVATLPVTLLVFHRVQVYGCVSGLLLIPLTMCVIALGAMVMVWPHPILCQALEWIVDIEVGVAEWFVT